MAALIDCVILSPFASLRAGYAKDLSRTHGEIPSPCSGQALRSLRFLRMTEGGE